MNGEKQGHIMLGDPEIGQGKTTFAQIVITELANSAVNSDNLAVQRLTPAQLAPSSRIAWAGMETIYATSWLQKFAGGHRASGHMGRVDREILRAANRDVLRQLKDSESTFVTVHGFMGKDVREIPAQERIFIEGDMRLEPMAVDRMTQLVVPTVATQNEAFEIAKQQGFTPEITVAGYLVPQQLLNSGRPQKLMDFYAQGKLTSDDPLRISYLMTGQGAHLGELDQYIFRDPGLAAMIRDGQVKVDVYTSKNAKKAQKAADMARKAGFDAGVTNSYNPSAPEKVQVFWHPDTVTGVENSFRMAEHGHLLVSPAAERLAWPATMPFVVLPAVVGNQKMLANTNFLRMNNLTGPVSGIYNMGATVTELFAHRGLAVRRHFDNSHIVFEGLLEGGKKAAKHIIEVYNASVAA